MAKTLSKAGVTTGTTVEAWHVTQSIDAFAGTDAYNISLSGSIIVAGAATLSGSLNNLVGPTVITANSITLKGPTTVLGYSLGVGMDNTSTGTYSLSQGLENITSAPYASSFGHLNNVSGTGSQAFGNSNIVIGSGSQAAGLGLIASGSSQLVCGRHNTHGDETSLFIVGRGPRNITKVDAFKVTHSGSIVVPTSSLEPNWAGQEGEIISYNASGNYRLYMWMNGAWRTSTFS
jgi:hypothetical protein